MLHQVNGTMETCLYKQAFTQTLYSLVHSLHCQLFFAYWKKSWQWRLGTRLTLYTLTYMYMHVHVQRSPWQQRPSVCLSHSPTAARAASWRAGRLGSACRPRRWQARPQRRPGSAACPAAVRGGGRGWPDRPPGSPPADVMHVREVPCPY